ncbi:MAG: hypothetical protein ACXWVP_08860, partial [Burkholderiales bacterium]
MDPKPIPDRADETLHRSPAVPQRAAVPEWIVTRGLVAYPDAITFMEDRTNDLVVNQGYTLEGAVDVLASIVAAMRAKKETDHNAFFG